MVGDLSLVNSQSQQSAAVTPDAQSVAATARTEKSAIVADMEAIENSRRAMARRQ